MQNQSRQTFESSKKNNSVKIIKKILIISFFKCYKTPVFPSKKSSMQTNCKNCRLSFSFSFFEDETKKYF